VGGALWIEQGNLGAAVRWAQRRGLSAEDELDHSREFELEHVTLARLLIAQGNNEEAAGLLERLLRTAEEGGQGWRVIETLVLKALALRALNDEPGALAALERALALAEPEGYIRTFANEGAPIAHLLRRLLKERRRLPPSAKGTVSPEYVGKLLEALDPGVVAPAGAGVSGTARLFADPISERELDVLRLLDSELSNREIATRLFVSLDTVKSHTKHIYAKLGVGARHQAVSRARELGLL
jgi:LuxR family maltose regulon positive regulatory protein